MNNTLSRNGAVKLLSIVVLFMSSTFTLAAEQSIQSCLDIASRNLPDADITVAEVVAAGEFMPPSSGNNRISATQPDYAGALPEFCRVTITLRPSDDSDIKMELWLPTDDWNGKYLAVGNGAFTGNVRHSRMVDPITRGYATSSTSRRRMCATSRSGGPRYL